MLEHSAFSTQQAAFASSSRSLPGAATCVPEQVISEQVPFGKQPSNTKSASSALHVTVGSWTSILHAGTQVNSSESARMHPTIPTAPQTPPG